MRLALNAANDSPIQSLQDTGITEHVFSVTRQLSVTVLCAKRNFFGARQTVVNET
jgi:hypothetical protein